MIPQENGERIIEKPKKTISWPDRIWTWSDEGPFNADGGTVNYCFEPILEDTIQARCFVSVKVYNKLVVEINELRDVIDKMKKAK